MQEETIRMALKIASGTTTSTAANTKSANLVSGTYEFAPNDGTLAVYARGSAKADHEVASFDIPQGARVEFYLRNTTGGALTTDYSVELEEFDD